MTNKEIAIKIFEAIGPWIYQEGIVEKIEQALEDERAKTKGQTVSLDIFNELHSQWMDLQEEILDERAKAKELVEAIAELLETNDRYSLCQQDCFDTSDGHGYEMQEILKSDIAKCKEALARYRSNEEDHKRKE